MIRPDDSPENPLNQPSVCIVLAVFNGARYLNQQIKSIQEQSYTDWTLIVRDDGSADASLEIIRSLLADDPRITLMENRDHLGCSGSFAALLDQALMSGAAYVMLADQDDVWNRDKVAVELREMCDAEMERGVGTPLLVHTDLTVVDAGLKLVHKSFLSYCQLRHEADQPLKTLLVQNFVTGCTIMANRALLMFALPIPANILVHDWWLAMCAAATGEIRFLSSATILYRQHEHNAIGAASARRGVLYHLRHRADMTRITVGGIIQVRQLLNRLEDRNCHGLKSLEFVQMFCRAFGIDCSRTMRLILLLRTGVRRQRLIGHIGWLWDVMRLNNSAFPKDAFNRMNNQCLTNQN